MATTNERVCTTSTPTRTIRRSCCMLQPRCGTLMVALILLLSDAYYTSALRNVHVEVPIAARRGDKATLKCFYDLEGDLLYSVKWYKGRREIYSYSPKDTPAMKVYELPSEKVDRLESNETQLVLGGVTRVNSGKYSCEVSADAPSFHTMASSGHLDIVDPPHQPPYVNGIRTRYRIGEILNGNCTSRHSLPAANLTWFVNQEEVLPPHVRHHRVQRDKRTKLETSILKLHFVVAPQHFINGKMKLRCTAQIHDLYWRYTDRLVMDADMTRHYGNGHNSHSIGNALDAGEGVNEAIEPYDQYALHDGELLRKKESNYLTQLTNFFYKLVGGGGGSGTDGDNGELDAHAAFGGGDAGGGGGISELGNGDDEYAWPHSSSEMQFGGGVGGSNGGGHRRRGGGGGGGGSIDGIGSISSGGSSSGVGHVMVLLGTQIAGRVLLVWFACACALLHAVELLWFYSNNNNNSSSDSNNLNNSDTNNSKSNNKHLQQRNVVTCALHCQKRKHQQHQHHHHNHHHQHHQHHNHQLLQQQKQLPPLQQQQQTLATINQQPIGNARALCCCYCCCNTVGYYAGWCCRCCHRYCCCSCFCTVDCSVAHQHGGRWRCCCVYCFCCHGDGNICQRHTTTMAAMAMMMTTMIIIITATTMMRQQQQQRGVAKAYDEQQQQQQHAQQHGHWQT